MGEQRINPDTGVVEEDQSVFGGVLGHDWQPARNDEGREERVNTETGVREEDQSVFGGVLGHDWQPARNDEGREERVNTETGVREEDQSVFGGVLGHDWQPARNDEGREERVNTETGVREEDQSVFGGVFGHDWQPTRDNQGRSERINPNTGVIEEDQSIFQGFFGHDWQPKRGPKTGAAAYGLPEAAHARGVGEVRHGHHQNVGGVGAGYGERTWSFSDLWPWIVGGFVLVGLMGVALLILFVSFASFSNQKKNNNPSFSSRESNPNTSNTNAVTSGTRGQARIGAVGNALLRSRGTWRAINMTNGLRGNAAPEGGFYYGYFEYINFADSDRGRTLNVAVKSQYLATKIELWRGNIAVEDHAWWAQHQKVATSSEGSLFEHKPELHWVITPGTYTLFFPSFSQSGGVSNLPFFAKLDITPSEGPQDFEPSADRVEDYSSRTGPARPWTELQEPILNAFNNKRPLMGEQCDNHLCSGRRFPFEMYFENFNPQTSAISGKLEYPTENQTARFSGTLSSSTLLFRVPNWFKSSDGRLSDGSCTVPLTPSERGVLEARCFCEGNRVEFRFRLRTN